MLSRSVQVGMCVRVGDDAHYGSGLLGTVTQVYGASAHRAAEVTFEEGRTVLYWHFQIEPVEQEVKKPQGASQPLALQR